jgi:NAD(P)-dependent dehydrogenase (short-subunit alcohol dehydrogenase family)
VADWEQASALIDLAVETFGDLHVLVNNAGILRDRTLANLTEDEWDPVIRVHLKGHAATSKHAMTYWRGRSKSGHDVKASVIHTSSIAGLTGNFGQAAYSAAKLGIVALSRVVAIEGAAIGVRSNVVSPSARTRLAMSTPEPHDFIEPPADPNAFDFFSPANVSPLVAWLAQEFCQANSQVFQIGGNRLMTIRVAKIVDDVCTNGQWTLDQLDAALSSRMIQPLTVEDFIERMRPQEVEG